ncbi:MAG: GNAT family N-acetyltransferase, partial [Anaerolineae bacterium]|nr:GNAT family N-acetyltransferase [Gemmatimonadaceae bacterium]
MPEAQTTAIPQHKPRIEVVRVASEHAEALADFFQIIWSDKASAASIRAARAAAAAANPVEPGTDIPAFAYLSDGKVLGYISTIPTRLWNGVTEHAGHWFIGFMVLPEFRGGPVGYAVLKEAMRQLGLIASMAVALPPRRLFKALGFTDYGAIANYLTLIRPARVFRALDLEALSISSVPGWAVRVFRFAQRSGLAAAAGLLGNGALIVWRTAAGGRTKALLREGMPTGPEMDGLWNRARSALAGAPVRDGAYLVWRYGASHGEKYVPIAARDATELSGIAIVRRPRDEGDPRLRGIKVATLSDILFVPDRRDVALGLLAAAERVARSMGADALLCTASHPAIASLLPRRAYLKLPGNVHFLVRDPKDEHAMPRTLADWWLTRGDANSDEV